MLEDVSVRKKASVAEGTLTYPEHWLQPQDFLRFVDGVRKITKEMMMSDVKGKKIVDRLKRFAETLEGSETITDKYTCRTIRLNLKPQSYTAELVKLTRGMLGTSQAIFAQFLGVSVKTVHDWEQDRKKPMDVACRLMDEIRRDPKYWLNRLKELSLPVQKDAEAAKY